MMHRRALAGAMTCLVVGGWLLAGDAARASHYRLPAAGLVTKAETKSLSSAGVGTTKALLDGTAKVRSRRRLAKKTRISYARLTELATQCDLLRVAGLGPTMVRLLQASGIRHSGTLRQARASGLRGKMAAANQVHKIADVLPAVESIQAWINSARGLRKLLEGVR